MNSIQEGYKMCPNCKKSIKQYWYEHRECGWKQQKTEFKTHNNSASDPIEQIVGKKKFEDSYKLILLNISYIRNKLTAIIKDITTTDFTETAELSKMRSTMLINTYKDLKRNGKLRLLGDEWSRFVDKSIDKHTKFMEDSINICIKDKSEIKGNNNLIGEIITTYRTIINRLYDEGLI